VPVAVGWVADLLVRLSWGIVWLQNCGLPERMVMHRVALLLLLPPHCALLSLQTI
jgi:hypothetical protein